MLPQPTRWSMVLAAVIVVLVGTAAQACPMCSQALADGRGGDLVAGYFWSIVFMMSMPFVLVSALGLYFYLQVRKARAAQHATHPSATCPVGSASPVEGSGSAPAGRADQDAELIEV